MASTSAAAAFYADFQCLKADVVTALEAGTGAPAALSALRTALAGARASLPPYDQRSYDLQVRELEGKLAATRVESKPKFAFRRAPKSTASTPTATPTPSVASTPAAPATPTSPADASTYTLSDRSDARLSASDLSSEGTYTLTLSRLTRCVIDLRSASAGVLTSLHASDLTDCVLLAPRMAGSAMLTSAVGCVLALGAQQFRLHNSRACAVALSVGSLPVIEGCNVLVFVQYPSTWGAPENDGDKFANVQDFDWVRDGPSPHWRRGDGEEQSAVHAALQAVVDGADASTIQSIPCIQRNTN